jgi:hypothetical protein
MHLGCIQWVFVAAAAASVHVGMGLVLEDQPVCFLQKQELFDHSLIIYYYKYVFLNSMID